jgi:hypothetical protein
MFGKSMIPKYTYLQCQAIDKIFVIVLHRSCCQRAGSL